ncbi:MAG: nuclear transport factor 2 family protein [Acidimicrobiia bacterium]|nr:nuclear transport factor 2 family protein [Acidimicrobiia bacterium]
MDSAPSRLITERLLAALASRDLRRIEAALSPECSWRNVPHPAAEGRDAVLALLSPIVTWSDRVQWDVLSAAYDETTAWLERADRFWIDGSEHTVLCTGVFEVDVDTGTVRSVRDYVDLGEWRGRVGPALDAMTRRSPDAVVDRHLAAVVARDPVAMAADYAPDAVLRRGADEHRGWRAIADYFDTVPARLDGLRFSLERSSGDPAAVYWELTDDTGTVVARGTDRYRIAEGRITEQTVDLDTSDF